MASSQVEVDDSCCELKYLGFVKVLAINAVVFVSNLYDSAKQNSGSYKSAFERAEGAVTAVVSPVYSRVKGVPGGILAFIDKKVDEATNKFNECAPTFAKNLVSKAQSIFRKASELASELTAEAQVKGPLAAISHAGTISKQVAVNLLVVVWYKANKHPILHGLFEMAIPTAAHWSEKYNNLVKNLSTKGFTFMGFVPLVPVEEISMAYKQVEAAEGKSESDKE
ncbi:rubber elongation factor protein (REF) [Striga asiatica]|uniref:Rubber elongation factor protein (REF) n=1 Tax=Striga asiatica TaxID=4170 RepID=A0A5A7QJY6_STRAF|nr:rubber elongation factor protein (REF) [Striga asiatica]